MSVMNYENSKSIYGMETFYQLHERELSKAPFGIPVLGDEVIPEL